MPEEVLFILPGEAMARSGSRPLGHRGFAALVSVLLLSAQPCCPGTEECSHTFHMNIRQGSSESVILPINTTGQILLLHSDEKLLGVGLPNHLNKVDDKTEVSLYNQNFTLQNVKKADEGLYQIKDYITKRCLAQVYVTVPDPSPSPDITNLPNANVSVTPTPFHPENNNTVIHVLVVVFVIVCIIIILAIVIILKCKTIITCIKERMSKSRRNASAGFSPEEESVL